MQAEDDPLSLFKRLQLGDQIYALIRIETKDGHRRVANQNAFPKGFCEIFHIIAQMQLTKWWCCWKRACAGEANRMTLRAPFLCQPSSQSRVAIFGASGQGKEEHERAREDTPVWMAHGRCRPGDKCGNQASSMDRN